MSAQEFDISCENLRGTQFASVAGLTHQFVKIHNRQWFSADVVAVRERSLTEIALLQRLARNLPEMAWKLAERTLEVELSMCRQELLLAKEAAQKLSEFSKS